jgi:gliding motility-associated-like protein
MKNFWCFAFVFVLFVGGGALAKAQLAVSSGLTPAQYVDFLVGNGITYSNVVYTGDVNSIGKFITGAAPTNLGIGSGVIMSTGYVNGSGGQPAIGSPVSNFVSSATIGGSDPQLQSLIPGYTINDATLLQFDFIPVSDTVRFRYVFGSEEYNEWVGSTFNDVFGFFISGPNPAGGSYTNYNMARIPGTALPVTIDNVNSGSYSSYYVNNEVLNGQTIVYDGFTVVLTAWTRVTPCQTYHIKLAIGDAGDASFDSGVFLEANSFSSPVVTASTNYVNDTILGNFAMEGGCNDAIICFSLSDPATSNFTINYTLQGSATNGVDYPTFPTSMTIPAGSDSVCYVISPYADGISEGMENIIIVLQNQISCNTVSDTIVIDILDYDDLQINMTPDTTICGGSAIISTLPSMGVPPYSYVWDNGLPALNTHTVSPTNTTTYTVTITDFCGFQISDSVTITVGSGLAEAGPDQEICEGETATLAANSSASYLWSTGETTQSIDVSPNSETMYFVTVTGICDGYDSVTVSVNPLPVVVASIDPASVCAGDSANLWSSGALNYVWEASPSDISFNPIPGATNDFFTVAPKGATTYSVTGTDANGCSSTASTSLTVVPLPVASFFTQPPVASSFDPTFHFYDNSQGSPVFWQWSLSDGSEYFLQDFIHQFPVDEYGDYEVILYVENSFGCSDSIVGSVRVKPDYTLYIPNSFSPNEDGINDYFHISGINFPDDEFSIRIYDRWGNLVFASTNPSFQWDGEKDGSDAPTGTYIYRIYYRDTDGNYQVRQGNITLWY